MMYQVSYYRDNPRLNRSKLVETLADAIAAAEERECIVYIENVDDEDDWARFANGALDYDHLNPLAV